MKEWEWERREQYQSTLVALVGEEGAALIIAGRSSQRGGSSINPRWSLKWERRMQHRSSLVARVGEEGINYSTVEY